MKTPGGRTRTRPNQLLARIGKEGLGYALGKLRRPRAALFGWRGLRDGYCFALLNFIIRFNCK